MNFNTKDDEIKTSFWEKLPSRNLVFVTFIVTFGSAFHIGYNAVILNVPHKKLSARIHNILKTRGLDELAESEVVVKMIWAFFNSTYFLGGTIGAVIAVLDKYNRVRVIFITCGITILTLFVMAVFFFTESLIPICLGRFMQGIISGVFSSAVPIYLSEIAPVRTRGMVCSCFSMMQAAGILAAFVCGYMENAGDKQWILIIMLPEIPILLQFIFMRHCRRSPKFLLIKKQEYDEAFKSLQWFRRTDKLHILERELEEISRESQDAMLDPHMRWADLFTKKSTRKPMLISIMIMCAQQFSGVNLFLLYSTYLFEEIGVSSFYAYEGTIAIGIALLVMSIVSMLLVEVTGRRMLMLYGYVGIFIFSLMHYLAYTYNNDGRLACVGAVAGLFIWYFIIHYALGPGSVPWILIPEIFNQISRTKAVAVAASCNWLLSCIVVLAWPLISLMGPNLFLVTMFFQVIFFILLFKYVPETSNKTIKESSDMYLLYE